LRYVISYDLTTQGLNYQPLYDALGSVGAKRIFESQWVVRWNNSNAANIRAYVQRYLEPGDRLMVSSLDSGDWAGHNLISDPSGV
jgi:hypothetical protein